MYSHYLYYCILVVFCILGLKVLHGLINQSINQSINLSLSLSLSLFLSLSRLRVSRFRKLRKEAAADRLHECEISIRDEAIGNDEEEGINKYFNWINKINLFTCATT